MLRWGLWSPCCPEWFGTKICQHCPWTLSCFLAGLAGIGIPQTQNIDIFALEFFFQAVLKQDRDVLRGRQVYLFLPLPKCQRCLWCRFYSKRVVWCNCSQQHCFFQEQDLLLPFLPSPESAQQSTRKETRKYLNMDHSTQHSDCCDTNTDTHTQGKRKKPRYNRRKF